MAHKKISSNIENIVEKPIKLEKSKLSKPSKKVLDTFTNSESDSEIDSIDSTRVVKPIIKPKRVQSEAQKAAFVKAQIKLAEGRAIKKAIKDKEIDEYNKFKSEKITKKEAKKEKKQKAEIEALETSSEEPIVVKKKRSKKIVYVSDDDEPKKKEPINIIINNTTPTTQENNNKPKGKFSVFI
jgi:hypothetical protein